MCVYVMFMCVCVYVSVCVCVCVCVSVCLFVFLPCLVSISIHLILNVTKSLTNNFSSFQEQQISKGLVNFASVPIPSLMPTNFLRKKKA